MSIQESDEYQEVREFECTKCSKTFQHSSSLSRHMKSHKEHNLFICLNCGKSYRRKDSLGKHKRKENCGAVDVEVEWICKLCDRTYQVKSSYVRHLKTHNSTIKVPESEGKEVLVEISDEEEMVYDVVVLKKETVLDIPVFDDSDEDDESVVDSQSEEPISMDIITEIPNLF